MHVAPAVRAFVRSGTHAHNVAKQKKTSPAHVPDVSLLCTGGLAALLVLLICHAVCRCARLRRRSGSRAHNVRPPICLYHCALEAETQSLRSICNAHRMGVHCVMRQFLCIMCETSGCTRGTRRLRWAGKLCCLVRYSRRGSTGAGGRR